jgi:hypothetical protein
MNDKYKKIIEDILAPDTPIETVLEALTSLKPGHLLTNELGDNKYTLRRQSDWKHNDEQVVNVVRNRHPTFGFTQTLMYLGHCKCAVCKRRYRREGPGREFHTILSTADGESKTFKITTRRLYILLEQMHES